MCQYFSETSGPLSPVAIRLVPARIRAFPANRSPSIGAATLTAARETFWKFRECSIAGAGGAAGSSAARPRTGAAFTVPAE
jgi:hypothetical protein